MDTNESSKAEKDELWDSFVSLIQLFGNKRKKKEQSDLVEFIATSVDDLNSTNEYLLLHTDFCHLLSMGSE